LNDGIQKVRETRKGKIAATGRRPVSGKNMPKALPVRGGGKKKGKCEEGKFCRGEGRGRTGRIDKGRLKKDS